MSHLKTPSIRNESDSDSISPLTYHVPAFTLDFIQPNPHARAITDPDPGHHLCNISKVLMKDLSLHLLKVIYPPINTTIYFHLYRYRNYFICTFYRL